MQIINSVDWVSVLETVPLASITAWPTVRAPWEPITALEFQYTVTRLYPNMRVAVTGVWGFPAVPGTVRQAVLDAVASTLDTSVEYYQEDMSTVSVRLARQAPGVLHQMPLTAEQVARSFRVPGLR